MNSSIGVLDSGVGGLSVLRKLKEILPNEDYIYLGDTARTPYGIRTEAEIRNFVFEMLDFFEKKQVKLVVVACNTLTMLGIDSLKKDYSFEIIGMEKGANLIAEFSKNKKAAILATPFTVNTGLHKKEILKKDPSFEVLYQACDDFVPLVEKGEFRAEILKPVVQKYMKNVKNFGADIVLLGCTHYPFLQKEIKAELSQNVRIIDPAEETSKLAKDFLEHNDLKNNDLKSFISINATKDIDLVRKIAKKMFDISEISFQEIKI